MFFAQVWAILLVLNMKQKTRQPFPINNDGARAGLQVKQMFGGRADARPATLDRRARHPWRGPYMNNLRTDELAQRVLF